MTTLQTIITHYFDAQDNIDFNHPPAELERAIHDSLDGLNEGHFRVAEKKDGGWVVHDWLKKAVLLFFKRHPSALIQGGFTQFYDKIPMKFDALSAERYAAMGVRVVPGAIARFGSFIGKNTIIMPSFINIGAYIDEGTMVDAWATVGSCAQVGKNVHLSGGVGIGGVLEPLQASPTIIEDDCFIGARSEVVEGVVVETGSVLSMGVYLGQSTKIYNRLTGEITYGRIPAGSVVVSGSLPSDDGTHSLYCAVIVKQVDAKTRAKVGLNELLRVSP